MTIREIRATGLEALNLASALLQRCRLADPYAGVFEAADVQWSWRKPRLSDQAEKTFWLDADGPVAGMLLTSSGEFDWQIDPVILPGQNRISTSSVWQHMMGHIIENPSRRFTIPISNDDSGLTNLTQTTGFLARDKDSTGWLDAVNPPGLIDLPDGFTLVDRSVRVETKHPMSDRNGDNLDDRLQQCSLYDPTLDLSIETHDGQVAGYSLYWFDPVTRVGLVEPVRVHDAFQRKGLARAMLARGIHRLVARGAERIKVSWETDAAGALYIGTGFSQTSTTTWYSPAQS